MDSDSLFCVFNFLKIRDIHNCLLTNKQFNNVAQNEFIWKRLHEIDFYNVQMKGNYSNYKRCYVLDIGLNQLENSINSNKLELGYKNINGVPLDLFSLTHLTEFRMHCNQLEFIPREIGQLVNLAIISLSGNWLISIPKEIGLLSKLNSLLLNDNRLQSIPVEMCLLTDLAYLNLAQNPLQTIPQEINKLNKVLLVLDTHQQQLARSITVKTTIRI